MGWGTGDGRRAPRRDATRDRSVLINQILLGAVTLVATFVAAALGQIVDTSAFATGLALIYATAAAGAAVPWSRLPYASAGVLAVVDIIGVAFLRSAAPEAGLGLLWMFPAMWAGAAFGVAGVVGAGVLIGATVGTAALLDPALPLSTSTVLLPLTIVALATISAVNQRRASAQRSLLDRQSADLRRTAVRARRQEDLVTEVLDAVDFGVIRVTADGALVVTNEAHARLQGTGWGDTLAVSAFAPDGETELVEGEVPLERARRGERFENELVWYGEPGRGRRALSVTARGLVDPDGSDAGTIVVSRDVTIEEQALRARDDLVASVSHELRTPLTSIIGYLDLALDDDAVSAHTRRDLEVAQRNAERLLELVADILAMSQLSHGGRDLALDTVPVDLADIVLAAVEAEAPRAAQRGVRIDAADVRPARAPADARRIRQVVDNLLTNAVKYNNDGGQVHVSVVAADGEAWIEVRDDGPGISQSELPHLFERFFRADAVRNSSVHGSGLGLAISRDIARAHGGDIVAESREGEGSTFLVRLPTPSET